MGCTPLCNAMSNAIQRLRRKTRKRKSLKAHPPTEGSISRSVSQGNGSPIYITHPPGPPHDIPNATLSPLPPPAHAFPTTSETKEIVEFQGPDPEPVSPSSDDTEYYQHRRGHESEPCFVTYGCGSPGLSSGLEDGSKRDGFYGEYQYYPTPVREGIYNLIDSSRLSTIFSDENPNACSIS